MDDKVSPFSSFSFAFSEIELDPDAIFPLFRFSGLADGFHDYELHEDDAEGKHL